MGDSTKQLVDVIKDNIKARIEHLAPDVRAEILEAVEQWAGAEAIKARSDDPDRLKRATEKGSKGLMEPEA